MSEMFRYEALKQSGRLLQTVAVGNQLNSRASRTPRTVSEIAGTRNDVAGHFRHAL